jgi:hypothetical protein
MKLGIRGPQVQGYSLDLAVKKLTDAVCWGRMLRSCHSVIRIEKDRVIARQGQSLEIRMEYGDESRQERDYYTDLRLLDGGDLISVSYERWKPAIHFTYLGLVGSRHLDQTRV